jgi:hypothetical protein
MQVDDDDDDDDDDSAKNASKRPRLAATSTIVDVSI